MKTYQYTLIAAMLAAFFIWNLPARNPALGQSTQVSSGINYLKSTQNADGSWGGTPASLNGVFPVTAAAFGTLRALEPTASTNQANATQFLASQSVAENPFHSARIVALAGTTSNTSADLNALLASQSADGGWGTADDYESDALDTAYALIALKAAGVGDVTKLAKALNYLAATQNADGGWALTKGEDSQVFYTAIALQALNSCRLQFFVSNSQARAIGFLRGRHNADGGYGAPSSTAFETASALLAILGSGQPLTPAEAAATNFLRTSQLTNGSWVDDAYSTALALRALAFPRDTDADGMPDDFELANGLNPNDPSDASLDNDGDGLANLAEYRGGTNPNNRDTDGDGVDDLTEIANGSDPRDPASRNRAPVITSQPVVTAREQQPYSYQTLATDPDGDQVSLALLQGPGGMTIAPAGLIQWTPASNQFGNFNVIIKASDGRGGSSLQQYRLNVLATGIDFAVAGVDTSQVNTAVNTLVINGAVRVDIENRGGSFFDGSFQVLLFEDRNNNGSYQSGVDNSLAARTFSGSIASSSVAPLNIPVSGIVQFRDNLIYAFVDSASQIPELDETNNVGSSGEESRYQPPAGDFQPKVKWEWTTPFNLGVFHAPIIAPLIDTNNDGLVNDRDVPAVIVVPGSGSVDSPIAVRGDNGQTILPGTPAASRRLNGNPGNPAVGDLDGDGRPEIVANGFNQTVVYCFNNDGSLKWTSPPTHRIGLPVIADLEGDGQAEVISGTAVLNSDGSVRFDRGNITPDYVGGPNGLGNQSQLAVDLDLDGTLEIVAGPSAYDKDGTRIWSWQSQGLTTGQSTLVGTLDRGATIVNVQSNVLLSDSYTAVANLDSDPNPEIISVTTNPGSLIATGVYGHSIEIFEHDGRLKAVFPLFFNENGLSYQLGAPTVADFDGDGQPEIAMVVGRSPAGVNIRRPTLYLFEYRSDNNTLELKWQKDLLGDLQAEGIPLSAFDFDGDGATEAVLLDNHRLYILDGRNGSTQFELGVDRANEGGTTVRYPTIADIDNDGSAEIVVPTVRIGNAQAGSPPRMGLLVLGDTKDNWLNARRVWNQNRYHITNVDEDGGIPRTPRRNWLIFNNHLTQSPIDGLGPHAARDLTVSRVTINSQGCPATAGITARIGSGGSLHAGPGVRVNFYLGDPAVNGALIGTRQTTSALYPGAFEDLSLDWNAPVAGQVFVTVNDPPQTTLVQSNNLQRLPSAWAQGSGYLANVTTGFNSKAWLGIDGGANTHWQERPAGTNYIPTGPTLYEVRFPFPVNATSVRIENNLSPSLNEAFQGVATLTFSNGFSVDFALDGNGEGSVAFAEQQDVMWTRLTSTATKTQGAGLSEFIVGGSYREPQFRINEGAGRLGNNKAASPLTASPCDATANQPPVITSAPPITASPGVAYSYQVQASDPNGDALTYSLGAGPQGMSFNATGLISWTPTEGQTGDNAVTVQVSDGRGGSAEQSFAVSVAAPPGVNHAPAFSSSLLGSITIGQTFNYDANAVDLDGDTVVFALLQSPTGAVINQFSGLIGWTPSASQVGAQVFTLEVQDGRGGRATQSFIVQVQPSTTQLPPQPQDRDADGFDETVDCNDNNPSVNPGRAEIPGNGLDDDCNPATPDALPANVISCSITTDKRSYGANSLAQLTVRIQNQSSTLTVAGLQALVVVRNQSGQQVFSSPFVVPPLQPSQLFKAALAMSTGALAPGAYQATLDVTVGSTSACSSTASFTLVPSHSQGRALTGSISATPTQIERGAGATFNYQVSNVGNVDIATLNLKVLVVNVASGLVSQTLTDQTSLNRGQSFTNSRTFSSSGVDAGDYLVVLQGESSGISQTVGSAFLKINPSANPTAAAGAVVRHAPAINGNSRVQGSVRQLTGEGVTLNGGAVITGDLLVPGTPTVRKNGNPILGGIVEGAGSAQPSGYSVTLNGNVQLGRLVLRTDPIPLPVVTGPPAATGTRDVTLNGPGESVGDFATVRDLTLNGNAGTVSVPPGTYRNFTANGANSFVFGVAGSTQPAVYNLRSLTLNGQSRLQIAGPVTVIVGTGVTLNGGSMGNPGNPLWLILKVAAGGVTVNGGSSLSGVVLAPNGSVIINGNSLLKGSVFCDRLTINGGGVLDGVGDIGPLSLTIGEDWREGNAGP